MTAPASSQFPNGDAPNGDIHTPVMLAEVLDALAPKAGETHLDGTFGAGGYSRAILERADCRLYAIDRDPEAVARARIMEEAHAGRFTILAGTFGSMEALLAEVGVSALDGIVLDIGVSSAQLDTAERGFSFRSDGPLDMRMSLEGPSAADVVNEWEEPELARIIREYGEERFARRVASAIVKARAQAPIETTAQLADIVRGAIPKKAQDRIDPATRTFQALRIQVNDELGELDRALAAAERLLAPGGRLVVVAFHSLEDRRVKAFLKKRAGKDRTTSRHMPVSAETDAPSFTLVRSGALKPGEDEETRNPRARSARLRVAIRTDAPAMPDDISSGRGGRR